jgi:hypothetical protein
MKHLFLTLLFATLCAATSYAQTIKALGYNTTNGQIVAATNVVWTNAFSFSTNTVAAQVRTNVGLGWSALTNTNPAGFRGALGYGGNNTNTGDTPLAGEAYVYAAWGLWDTAENGNIAWRVEDAEIFIGSTMDTTNAPTNTTNAVRWLKVLEGTNSYRIPLYR